MSVSSRQVPKSCWQRSPSTCADGRRLQDRCVRDPPKSPPTPQNKAPKTDRCPLRNHHNLISATRRQCATAPLWEKVDRRVSAETVEGGWPERQAGTPLIRPLGAPSPTRGEGRNASRPHPLHHSKQIP